MASLNEFFILLFSFRHLLAGFRPLFLLFLSPSSFKFQVLALGELSGSFDSCLGDLSADRDVRPPDCIVISVL